VRRLSLLRSRFFLGLCASYAAVLAVTAVLVGVLVDRGLSRSLLDELRDGLEDQALLLEPLAERAFAGREPGLQELLGRFDRDTGVRITLVRPDGSVLADSEADPATMEDHGSRPEVRDARDGGFGVARRMSRTLGHEMLYVAHGIGSAEPLGTIRVALPTATIEARLAETRRSVLLGTAASFGVALLIGLLLARRFTRPIQAITSAADDLRAGRFEARVAPEPRGELGFLARTLNGLAQELTRRIASLSQEDAKLRAMLAGMVEGVVAVDAQDRILFANTAARRMLDLPAEELEGILLWEVAPIGELEALLRRVRPAATPERRELELFRGEREQVLGVHASAFLGGGGEGIVIVLHDLTDLRRLERVRRDFVANVSHELKTPLTSIKGFVETLLSGALHDQANNERFLRRIEANVERLNHLVSDLLSLARIESQGEGMPRAEVDWRSVLSEVVKRHEEACARKGLALELVGADQSCPVLGDREAMLQILDNLLDNAVKYTPAGRVRVSLSTTPGRGVLRIEDTGIGIPREHLERVFERFYRVDKARSREMGGTGLGLSIVKNLVENLAGEVSVESEVGRGSAFTVELPLARSVAASPRA
jgi:two-component system phosphate regulon sensor histidine kinase PhoR